MLPILSTSVILASVALACSVERFGKARIVIEQACGLLLIAGLSGIGGALTLFR